MTEQKSNEIKRALALVYAQEKLRIALQENKYKGNQNSEIDYFTSCYDNAYNYIG